MPKAPVWEYSLGIISVEEYFTNARGRHFEIRVGGSSSALVIFPHEINDLEHLIAALKAHHNSPRLALDERRQA